MTTKYATEQQDALEMITESGAAIVFLADAWTGGSIASDTTGQAVEIPGDPDAYRALGLVASNPVTVLVAAKGLGVTPRPGVSFRWAARVYTVTTATPLQPDGDPILWTLIGVS